MEKLSPTPSDIEAKMHQPRALQVLDSGERRADLGGTNLQLKDCDCEQLGSPEIRCNEIYEYELPADVIERANLGFDLDELPPFIGIKGGAARQVLESLVHSDRQLPPPRDVDLVILEETIASGDYDPDEIRAVASDLSMRFSPRDAINGYGAEYVESVAEFMNQHDFTLNQVLVHKDENGGWKLLASTQAVLDTAEHIIRPTVFEHDIDYDYRIGNKLALKAVRLLSDMQVQGIDYATIKSVQLPDDVYGDPRDDYFMQALQLDKALEVSYELAERYVENLKFYGMIPYGCEDMSAIEMYYYLVNETDFVPSDGVLESLRIERENRLKLGGAAKFDDVVERLLRQVPEQFSRDYYDSKK